VAGRLRGGLSELTTAIPRHMDTDRAGGSEPLCGCFCPKATRTVVLGIVTSKSGTLGSKSDDVKRSIAEESPPVE